MGDKVNTLDNFNFSFLGLSGESKETSPQPKYVLDSSAFFTFFENEDGADTVQGVLERAEMGINIVFVSFASFTEVYYITHQEAGEEAAQHRLSLMDKLSVTRIDFN